MAHLVHVPGKLTPHTFENLLAPVKILKNGVVSDLHSLDFHRLSDDCFQPWIAPEHCPNALTEEINMKLRPHNPENSVA
jgi:hypothetical protein